ncbi:MAG: DUF4336 domain-containing protein [Nannocystaceae bacterium]
MIDSNESIDSIDSIDSINSITEPFAERIWTVDGDRVRMFGIPFDTRMTVVQLAGGGLWIHSPVAATEARVQAVTALGPVAYLIAPNRFHYLFLGAWAERFADAEVWADPALRRRRPGLRIDHDLGPSAPEAWREDLEQVYFGGSAILPETVFFHRVSRTLIVTDVLQNHEPARDGWFARSIKRIAGIVAPDGGVPRDFRLSVRDRGAARRARDAILALDFERLIVTHGRCFEQGARPFVERAFQWLG